MTIPTILTNDEFHRRLDRTDKRARRVYSKAISLMRQNLPGQKISRLHALELAAGALESGARAFGIARPWPHAAAQLRRLHADLKATLEHAAMLREHAPSAPETKALADIDTILIQQAKYQPQPAPLCACGLHPQHQDGYCPAEQTARESHPTQED